MELKRKLFYLLPFNLRFLIRRLYFAPHDIVKYFTSKEIMPPKGLVYTGYGDFLEHGKKHLSYFKTYANLQPNHFVLDIGSGIGHSAIPLTDYLSENGKYEGFDVVKIGVDWCAKNISKRFPNFNFRYVPIFNDLYNNSEIKAANFEFPYSTNYFDFSFAMSVYTHMLPNEIDHYLEQTFNVLKPNGICLATFFYYDDLTIDRMTKKLTDKQFDFDKANYKLMDENVTSANVALDLEYLKNMIEAKGFKILRIIPGYWREFDKQVGNDYQDILVFQKR
jgi:SAM-dependent methyltransferase